MKRTKNRKHLAVVFAIIVAVCTGLFTAACGDPVAETKVTATKLLIDYENVKTEFEYEEPFTYDGLKVRAEMSDGSVADVSDGYTVSSPDMSPGQHMVTVTYGELSAKYPIFVGDMTKSHDDAEAFRVTGAGAYTGEAENINLEKCVAEPYDATEQFVKRTGSLFVSKNSYLQNFGVAGNCVGMSFGAESTFENVTLAVNVGNMTDESIVLSGSVAMYFGFVDSVDTGELDLTDITLPAKSWKTLAFEGLTLTEFSNFIIEFTDEANIVWDGIRVIVGADSVNSDSAVKLNAASKSPVTIEAEDMNTEKLLTADNVAAENNLKFGQPMLKNFTDGKSGKYVSDLKAGTVVSTVIDLDENANVSFKFNANIPAAYDLGANWTFSVDGFTFDAASVNTAGWTEVALATHGLKAGQHVFAAKLKGVACEVDSFVFAAEEFSGDINTLIEDNPDDNDLVVYKFGTYRIEAEELLDRSEWYPQFGTVDGMVEAWEHQNGAKGLSVGKIGSTKIKDEEGNETSVSTSLKLRFSLKQKAKMFLKMSVSDSNENTAGVIAARRISTSINDKAIAWTSDHKFGYDLEHTYWNWGEIDYAAIVLDAGEYTITTVTDGIGYDYYELRFADPTQVEEEIADAKITNFGSYKIEAENLTDRSGWRHNWGEDHPIDYVPGQSMIDSWSWDKDGSTGMGVTRIKPGSVFKIHFTLEARAAIKFNIRIRKWQGGANIPADDAAVKISDRTVTWSSADDFTHTGDNPNDMPWGVLECEPVTLDTGKHVIELTAGDVSFDWFEIVAEAPDEGK